MVNTLDMDAASTKGTMFHPSELYDDEPSPKKIDDWYLVDLTGGVN